MSQTIAMVLTQLLAIVLPIVGVTVGNDQITSFVQTAVVIGAGIWIWVRRYQEGDVGVFGSRKSGR
jgi:hypothetical protein